MNELQCIVRCYNIWSLLFIFTRRSSVSTVTCHGPDLIPNLLRNFLVEKPQIQFLIIDARNLLALHHME